MNTIISLVNLLKGKKAYLIGTLEIILGFINNNSDMVMIGFSTITVRAGIAKIGQ